MDSELRARFKINDPPTRRPEPVWHQRECILFFGNATLEEIVDSTDKNLLIVVWHNLKLNSTKDLPEKDAHLWLMNLDQSAAAAPDDSESDLSKQDGQVQVRLLEIVINDDERKPTAKPQIVSTTT